MPWMGSPNELRQALPLLSRQSFAVVYARDQAARFNNDRCCHHGSRKAATSCFIDARNSTVTRASNEVFEPLHQMQAIRLSKKLPF